MIALLLIVTFVSLMVGAGSLVTLGIVHALL